MPAATRQWSEMSGVEERAVDSVRAGRPDIEALYRAYGPAMRSSAAMRLGDGDALGLDAEDIVGQVIEGLVDGSVVLKPGTSSSLRAQLRRVAANKTVDLIREREDSSAAAERRHGLDTTDVQADVETMVLAEMAEERMFLLTEQEHYVMIERVKKDRPAKDVAKELGCTPQYVAQLRNSAVRKLFANLPFMDPP